MNYQQHIIFTNLKILGQNKNKTVAQISFQLDSLSPQSTISFGVIIYHGFSIHNIHFLTDSSVLYNINNEIRQKDFVFKTKSWQAYLVTHKKFRIWPPLFVCLNKSG